MSNEIISVKFLGKRYDFPKDIITYIDEHNSFENMRQELLLYMLHIFGDFQNLPNNFEETAFNQFLNYGNMCVKKLISRGIYDVTVNDVVGSSSKEYTGKTCSDSAVNEGVKLFYDSLRDAVLEKANALLEQMSSFLGQAQTAEQIRDSQITGTGFGIITNDIVGFGVWAAMEHKAIKEQSFAADAEFRAKIDSIQREGEMRSNSRLLNYEKNVWLPNLKNSVDLFIISLFKKYIDVLSKKGRFNPDALSYIDITKSQSILSNIDSTENKAGILDASFTTCPFCPELYEKAILLGDISDTIDCAKTFRTNGYLCDIYEEKCNEIANDTTLTEKDVFLRIGSYITILSQLYGKTVEDVTDIVMDKRRKEIKKSISKFVTDFCSAYDIEMKNKAEQIRLSAESIEGVCKSDLKNHVHTCIVGRFFNEDVPSCYVSFISLSEDKIVERLCNYSSEVKRRKEKYDEQAQKHTELVSTVTEQISECEEELRSLGFFSLSKKKEINRRISELKQKITDSENELLTTKRMYLQLI